MGFVQSYVFVLIFIEDYPNKAREEGFLVGDIYHYTQEYEIGGL